MLRLDFCTNLATIFVNKRCDMVLFLRLSALRVRFKSFPLLAEVTGLGKAAHMYLYHILFLKQ